MTLQYSKPAPDFALPSTGGDTVTLSRFRGQSDVVLAFYCFDWGNI